MTDTTARVSDTRLLSVLDATLLDDDLHEEQVRQWAHRLKGVGVAAICVQGHWIPTIRAVLGENAPPIAAVVNFPDGANSPWESAQEAARWIHAGATEIDVVVPTDTLARDGGDDIRWTVQSIREVAPHCTIKAILETGALPDLSSVRKAAAAAAIGGADFLKTSTGRHSVGATPEAVAALLDVMQAYPGQVGLKVSGGVATTEQAAQYWQQTERTMGPQWCHRKRFRIGASQLLHTLLAD